MGWGQEGSFHSRMGTLPLCEGRALTFLTGVRKNRVGDAGVRCARTGMEVISLGHLWGKDREWVRSRVCNGRYHGYYTGNPFRKAEILNQTSCMQISRTP